MVCDRCSAIYLEYEGPQGVGKCPLCKESLCPSCAVDWSPEGICFQCVMAQRAIERTLAPRKKNARRSLKRKRDLSRAGIDRTSQQQGSVLAERSSLLNVYHASGKKRGSTPGRQKNSFEPVRDWLFVNSSRRI